ncbi:hypothetical protein C4559_00365 [Candidatus Microgenomates bacterium]|nr:MAG: hypothetical protein C4559_00365 [Candidatus Microgenomates bacterium]
MSDIFVSPLKPKLEGQRTRTLADFTEAGVIKISERGETSLGDGHQAFFKIKGVGAETGKSIIGINEGESAIISGYHLEHKKGPNKER